MAGWGLELGLSGTQTKQDKDTHITCQVAASGVTPHPTASRTADTWQHTLPPCVPTSARSVSTCDASLPTGAAHLRRSLTTHRGGNSDTLSPARPTLSLPPTRGPRPPGVQNAQPWPLGAPRTGGSQTPQCAAPTPYPPPPSGAPGQGRGLLLGGLIGETEAGSLRDEGGVAGTKAAGSLTIVQVEQNWGYIERPLWLKGKELGGGRGLWEVSQP